MERPVLNKTISITDFENYYWLKEELVSFCKIVGISTNGCKMDLADRIKLYLKEGVITKQFLKVTSKSKFDWNNELLTTETKITDNYRNTENVRLFMIKQIGSHFRFNTTFMNWMKINVGKTLGNAVDEWLRIQEDKTPKKIAPQFEYNTYIRDFLADNPAMSLVNAIHYWKLKRNQKGNNRYSKNDLSLR